MTENTYCMAGQEILDDQGQYLATAVHDLTGRSVRWSKEDFKQNNRSIDFKNKLECKKLTNALWVMHKSSNMYDTNSDWVA